MVILMAMQIQSSRTKQLIRLMIRKGGMFPLFLFLWVGVSCNEKMSTLQFSGELEPRGMTSFQYGSHLLLVNDSLYALRSSTVDLASFEFKNVTLSGNPVEGYPIENGPVLIEVMKIELKDP